MRDVAHVSPEFPRDPLFNIHGRGPKVTQSHSLCRAMCVIAEFSRRTNNHQQMKLGEIYFFFFHFFSFFLSIFTTHALAGINVSTRANRQESSF